MLIGISDQMGTRFDRLRYEVFQNLILSPMNTGLLRPAVATVLTVYGIETYLKFLMVKFLFNEVATVLTVYGIETWTYSCMYHVFLISCNSAYRLRY